MNTPTNSASPLGGRLSRLLCFCLLLGALPSISPAHADLLAPGSPYVEDYVLGPTSPGNWGGPGATVTYSFASGVGYSGESGTIVPLESFMPYSLAAIKAQFVAAFNAWSSVANINFVEVVDNGFAYNSSGATGDIRIGGHAFDGAGGTLAHGYYPPINGTSAAGDIHFDSAETWKIGFGGGGFDIFQVAAHEIGHAIGLNHTGVPGSLMNPFYTEAFSGPQADDIAGATFIYGAAQSEVPEPSAGLLVVGMLAAFYAYRRAKA